MMMRFRIEFPAFSALHDHAMGIVMSHIGKEFCLAAATAIGLISAAFTGRASLFVLNDLTALSGRFGNNDHIKLWHGVSLQEKQTSDEETHVFLIRKVFPA